MAAAETLQPTVELACVLPQAAPSVVLETIPVSPHNTMTSILQPTLHLSSWEPLAAAYTVTHEPTEQANLEPQDRSDIDSEAPFIISSDEILASGTVVHSSNPSSLEVELGG